MWRSAIFLKKSSWIFVPIVMLSLVMLIQNKAIPIQPEKINTTILMRLNQSFELHYPDFAFESIQERYASEAGEKQNKVFPFCTIESPQLTFEMTDKIYFEGIPPKPLLIYNFEDIEYEQMLLDAYSQNNQIYVFFQDGTVVYVKINDDLTIVKNKVFKAQGLDKNEKIQNGYFVKLQDKLLFVSGKHAFAVENNSAQKIDGYQETSMFESVTSVNEQYFVTLGRHLIKIYRFVANESKLQVVDEYDVKPKPNIIQKQAFSDIYYYADKDALLVLDENLGVIHLQIDFKSDSPSFGQKKQIFRQPGCHIMGVNSMTKLLHVACERIYELDLEEWPQINFESNVNPGIWIEQLYCIGPFTAFIGRDAFRVMYWKKFAAYYEDQNLDRLIFNDDMYISANEDSLMIGRYYVNDTYVKCSITDPAYLGDHKLVLEVLAECNQQYFDAHSIDFSKYNYTQGDMCLYKSQLNVHVWSEGVLMIDQIQIVFALFAGILVLGLGVVAFKKWDLSQAQNQYNSFLLLNESKQQDKKGGVELVESAQGMKRQEVQQKVQPKNTNQSQAHLQNEQPADVNPAPKDLEEEKDKDFQIQ